MKNSYLNTVRKLLSDFAPVSLAEMDCVELMDRTDSKFVLSGNQLKPVLESLAEYYDVLTINKDNIFSYRTDYFDTPQLEMFSDHHNGKLNRFKVRQREYIESKRRFLEVKFKSSKGRVIKDRIEKTWTDKNDFSQFVRNFTPYNPDNLNLIVVNRFNRCTLVDKRKQERVTVDFNLTFNDQKHELFLNGLVIVEVKQNKRDLKSEIFKSLRNKGIRESQISKYCLGVSLLDHQVKCNNFKRSILIVNKLSHVELSA